RSFRGWGSRRCAGWRCLRAAERALAWSRASMNLGPASLAIHFFEGRVKHHPGATAAFFGNESIRFGELSQRAEQLARELQSSGIGPEVLVSLFVERSLDMLTGILAVLKAGGAYVPIDPDYPPSRVRAMLEQAGARLVLTQARLVDRLPPAAAPAVLIDAP